MVKKSKQQKHQVGHEIGRTGQGDYEDKEMVSAAMRENRNVTVSKQRNDHERDVLSMKGAQGHKVVMKEEVQSETDWKKVQRAEKDRQIRQIQAAVMIQNRFLRFARRRKELSKAAVKIQAAHRGGAIRQQMRAQFGPKKVASSSFVRRSERWNRFGVTKIRNPFRDEDRRPDGMSKPTYEMQKRWNQRTEEMEKVYYNEEREQMQLLQYLKDTQDPSALINVPFKPAQGVKPKSRSKQKEEKWDSRVYNDVDLPGRASGKKTKKKPPFLWEVLLNNPEDMSYMQRAMQQMSM
eukprot:GFYU01014301.1.p1 GENE.GFYU01014301.1~~GFYU01014301.1.p1  ORF type:complete len:293 (-),score=88.29 GFYU01014301.1:228-1106(-)